MKSYAFAAAGVFAAFLIIFLLVDAGSIPRLADSSPWLHEANSAAALVGVSLLVADAALPVPSSLVMIAHGALFGVVLGTLLVLLGSLGAMLVSFAIGRRGGPLLARIVSSQGRATAHRLLRRWGVLAIVITRPVPLLAETVAVLAGALPVALIYALTGAVAGSGVGVLVFVAVVAVAGGA